MKIIITLLHIINRIEQVVNMEHIKKSFMYNCVNKLVLIGMIYTQLTSNQKSGMGSIEWSTQLNLKNWNKNSSSKLKINIQDGGTWDCCCDDMLNGTYGSNTNYILTRVKNILINREFKLFSIAITFRNVFIIFDCNKNSCDSMLR